MTTQQPVADSELDELQEVISTAARAGGAELIRLFGKTSVTEKGPRDLVTEADVASQTVIQKTIQQRFPDHLFVGEETTSQSESTLADIKTSDQFCWVCDPLDGTTNYAHGMHGFAVSIAVLKQGELIAGAIFHPTVDDYFAAAIGRDATLNGKKISVTDCQTLSQSLVAASFAADAQSGSSESQRFLNMLDQCQAVRRLGSAALNLCFVADSRLDGYWATSVKTWDIAAGFLIARQAGAIITHIDGSEVDIWNPQFVAAATPSLHREMLESLKI